MTENFVHLHLHTEYSMVDSTLRIPQLIARCIKEEMPAIAITDQSNRSCEVLSQVLGIRHKADHWP